VTRGGGRETPATSGMSRGSRQDPGICQIGEGARALSPIKKYSSGPRNLAFWHNLTSGSSPCKGLCSRELKAVSGMSLHLQTWREEQRV
jgi:hypothetical protein